MHQKSQNKCEIVTMVVTWIAAILVVAGLISPQEVRAAGAEPATKWGVKSTLECPKGQTCEDLKAPQQKMTECPSGYKVVGRKVDKATGRILEEHTTVCPEETFVGPTPPPPTPPGPQPVRDSDTIARERATWFNYGGSAELNYLHVEGGLAATGMYLVGQLAFNIGGEFWFVMEGGPGYAWGKYTETFSATDFAGLEYEFDDFDLALGARHTFLFESNGDKANALMAAARVGSEFGPVYTTLFGGIGKAWYPSTQLCYSWYGQEVKDPDSVPLYMRKEVDVSEVPVDKTGTAWTLGLSAGVRF